MSLSSSGNVPPPEGSRRGSSVRPSLPNPPVPEHSITPQEDVRAAAPAATLAGSRSQGTPPRLPMSESMRNLTRIPPPRGSSPIPAPRSSIPRDDSRIRPGPPSGIPPRSPPPPAPTSTPIPAALLSNSFTATSSPPIPVSSSPGPAGGPLTGLPPLLGSRPPLPSPELQGSPSAPSTRPLPDQISHSGNRAALPLPEPQGNSITHQRFIKSASGSSVPIPLNSSSNSISSISSSPLALNSSNSSISSSPLIPSVSTARPPAPARSHTPPSAQHSAPPISSVYSPGPSPSVSQSTPINSSLVSPQPHTAELTNDGTSPRQSPRQSFSDDYDNVDDTINDPATNADSGELSDSELDSTGASATASQPLYTSKDLDFYSPDHENCLIFDADGSSIKAATFSKLIEHLTSRTSLVDTDDFLLTYRAFATPMELLHALIERFRHARPEDEKVVKIKSFNVMKAWIERYWVDFSEDPSVPDVAYQFFDYVCQYFPDSVNVALSVKSKLDKKILQVSRQLVKTEATLEKPLLLSDMNQPIIKFHPLEIARQLTLYEWDIWEQLAPTEFLGLAWTKAGKRENAPRIIAMTERFNLISSWVVTTICTQENVNKRVKKFLDVADNLRKMGNFNGMMEILSGLDRGPVFRLKRTMAVIDSDRKYSAIFAEVKALANRERNFAALRAAIKTIDPPVIPYLGMYLTDLMFIDEGNKDTVNGLINYYKCRLVSDTIKKVKQYQLKGYENLQKVPEMQEMLNSFHSPDEDDLYLISNYVEPRTDKEPGPRPAALDQIQSMLNRAVSQPSKSHSGRAIFQLDKSVPWTFNVPDTPQNILMDSRTHEIAAISLLKLVDRLTAPSGDTTALLPFLASFREFAAPSQVFDLLQIRFDVPPPEDKSPPVLQRYEEEYKGPLQARIIFIVKSWIQYHWHDFQLDSTLFTSLCRFIRGPVARIDSRLAVSLEDSIAKKQAGDPQPALTTNPTISPNIISIVDLDPAEIARQMTLDAYRQVMSAMNSSFLLSEVRAKNDSRSVLGQHDLAEVISMIQGKSGFEIKDRRKKFKTYAKCFVASDAIAWFVKHLSMTRQGAVQWGNHLLAMGVIESASNKDEPFEDNDVYFRFIPMNSRRDVILNERLRKRGSAVSDLIHSHLYFVEQFVAGEFAAAKQAGYGDSVIKAFIAVCRHLDELSNWHSLQAVVAGLQNTLSAVNKDLWEKVPNDDRQWFIAIRKTFLTPDDLRSKVLSLRPPAIPTFEVYYEVLGELFKLHGPPMLQENMIDYQRMLQIGSALSDLVRAQQVPYTIQLDPVVADYLSHIRPVENS